MTDVQVHLEKLESRALVGPSEVAENLDCLLLIYATQEAEGHTSRGQEKSGIVSDNRHPSAMRAGTANFL